MARIKKRDKANVPPGQETPLDFAVSSRDAGTLQMVQDAIHHKQVMLAFQPIMNASDQTTPAFYEGLIRVLDETGRVIPAKDFMGAVEDTELGRQLDCLALELGLAELSQNPSLRLSINMSARSIGYSRWMRSLQRGLRKRPDAGERLILEISEGSALQVPELVIDFMDKLQGKGIAFALDDFGKGFTSFRYFKDFYFDILKLDGQFSRNVHRDSENQIIAAGIAAIAERFDMYTVATRIEDPKDAHVLADLGFDCLQGFLFGPPTTKPDWQTSKNDRNAA
ncbi:EAL domain-containing protein [uncultured Shimia sp.]|uniref:EAL domain-containing protein n=1 Tax=uncultured Shimia sp. TaxID=573152 RepID=UPI00261DA44C|nr:EAL domain-containing protein [uncultured Shimia sp.]